MRDGLIYNLFLMLYWTMCPLYSWLVVLVSSSVGHCVMCVCILIWYGVSGDGIVAAYGRVGIAVWCQH